jgi:DNA polymerase elongation subunit (family B)
MSFKRLFFDIETSPNIGFFWSSGYKLNISHENIIHERAIICVCYKWEDEKQTHSIEWNKGDDKELLEKFMQIMAEADEVVGQNSDNFDIKWLRTRCLHHGIDAQPEYQSVDTYKLAKKYFRFNSNKLDYMSSFMGFGNKLHTGYDLWKKIVLENDKTSMVKMIKYCKKDVVLLEKVFKKMKTYVKHKTHVAVAQGETKIDCPECASTNTKFNGNLITATGTKFKKMQCQNCGRHYKVSMMAYNKLMENRNDKAKI